MPKSFDLWPLAIRSKLFVSFVSDYALISGCKPQEDSNLRPQSELATASSPLGSLIPQVGFKGNSVALIRNALQLDPFQLQPEATKSI